MCYVEDGGAAHAMQQDCGGLPGAIPQNYDCGRDDYFNPAPAAGSYLATHWNTYDSAFLAACGEVAPACGGGQLWVPEPPAATTSPSVGGTARRGATLTALAGAWTNSPAGYAYQWQRLVASGWEDIDGARSENYVASSEDLGRRLRVSVVASNEDGSSSAASPQTASIGGSGVNRAATSSSKGKKGKSTVKAKTSAKKGKKSSSKKRKGSKKKSSTKKKATRA
jgi:hypothetical protein